MLEIVPRAALLVVTALHLWNCTPQAEPQPAPAPAAPLVAIAEPPSTTPPSTTPPSTTPPSTTPPSTTPPPGVPASIPAPAEPSPWGPPLRVDGRRGGLRWTTTAQVQRQADALQLIIDIDLHNTTRAPMPISPQPPQTMVMVTTIPGWQGEGRIGMRGEGMGSDPCSHAPATLPADGHRTLQRVVDLDPLPWPPGQALRVTASGRDCRRGRLGLDLLAVLISVPDPASAPTLTPD